MRKQEPIPARTDEELVEKMRRGDEVCFEHLFERYYVALCRFAFSFVNSYEMSEELVTDVFVALWEKRRKLMLTTSLKVYLYAAVKYQCFAAHKKNIRMAECSWSEEISEEMRDSNTPLEHLLFKELKSAFDAAILILPPQCKLTYHMHFTEGLKYQEIAVILSISTKTVENHLGKALKTIRQTLLQLETRAAALNKPQT